MDKKHKGWVWVRNVFLTGLFVVIPMAATVWILRFVYRVLSGVLDPLVDFGMDWLVGEFDLPGVVNSDVVVAWVSFFMALGVVFGIGVLATNVLGKKLIHYVDGLFSRTPIVNLVYPLAKQVVESLKKLGSSGGSGFEDKKVVFVKYPQVNGYLVGFQTGEFQTGDGEKMVCVFIPTAPNPITGFVLLFHEGEVIKAGLPMDTTWKMLISAGLITPEQFSIQKGWGNPKVMDAPSGKEG